MSTRLVIGVIDYGVGNHASVVHALRSMGYRCIVSHEPEVLHDSDLMLLPGVGAFPAAMNKLHALNLVEFIKEQARQAKPILGICLGMQLLAESSTEVISTEGLNLIPGRVDAIGAKKWHIGWNSIEVVVNDTLFRPFDGHSFYFNHSYEFQSPAEYQAAVARLTGLSSPIVVAVHRNNVAGFQFHPEKSQIAGRQLLTSVIEGLCRA